MAKRLIPSLNRILAEKIVPPSKTTAGILLREKAAKVVPVAADNHYKRISNELLPRRSARDSNNDEVNTSDTQIAKLEKSNITVMGSTCSGDGQRISFGEKDLASDERMWSLYERWMAHYQVSRDLGEKSKRFNVFKENAKFILEFNKKYGRCMCGLNKFVDTSCEELMRTYTMGTYMKYESDTDSMYENVNNFPASVDSRAKGVLNAVKDQGECGLKEDYCQQFGEEECLDLGFFT